MKIKKNIIAGIILLIIWVIYYCFVIITKADEIRASLLIPYLAGIFALPGYLCLYYGLSLRNRGIMILFSGLLLIIPCGIFIAILQIDPFIAWADLIIALYTMVIVIWIISFILPSGYMIYSGRLPDNTKYNKKFLRYYIAGIGTSLVGMWFYLGLFGLIGETKGTDFRTSFFQNIWISIPIGIVIGPFIVGFLWEFRKRPIF